MPSLKSAIFGSVLRPSRLRVVSALVSFVIYGSAVASLQQYRENFFYCERVGLAAGVSNVVYGAPLGKVYPAIQSRFLNLAEPAQPILDSVMHLDTRLGDPLTAINDGNGLGFIVVASWAMRLFGPHLYSLPFFMLGLMGVSVMVFLWRFHDDRVAVATLTFPLLTLMLCTPLVSDPGIANQNPIGGIRYFSLLAILPAFHLGLGLTDSKEMANGRQKLHTWLLVVQVVLLIIAILVRGSAVSFLLLILVLGLVQFWRNRRDHHELRLLCRKASVMATTVVLFVGLLLVILPSRYATDGRLTTIFWHRAIVSLGVNPAWPFGDDLQQIYDCANDVPGGLIAGVADRNGGCVWWHWARTHNVPTEAANPGLYGREYEAVMRSAFFNIASLYPREVLAAFFYYKPEWILRSISQTLSFSPSFTPLILKILVVIGLANFFGFLVISRESATASGMLRLSGMGALFGISTVPTYLVAWATPHTIADLSFYCLFCIGMGLSAAMQPIRAVVKRTSAVRMQA